MLMLPQIIWLQGLSKRITIGNIWENSPIRELSRNTVCHVYLVLFPEWSKSRVPLFHNRLPPSVFLLQTTFPGSSRTPPFSSSVLQFALIPAHLHLVYPAPGLRRLVSTEDPSWASHCVWPMGDSREISESEYWRLGSLFPEPSVFARLCWQWDHFSMKGQNSCQVAFLYCYTFL